MSKLAGFYTLCVQASLGDSPLKCIYLCRVDGFTCQQVFKVDPFFNLPDQAMDSYRVALG